MGRLGDKKTTVSSAKREMRKKDADRVGQTLRKTFKHYWLELLLLLVILLKLPSLFEPFTYGDEGIYVTLGQAIRQGVVLYREIHDNKPPLLYLLAAVAGSFDYFRLILFFWGLATIFLFHKLSLFLFPKNKPAVIASTSIFAILTSLHVFEGNVANAENFMMLPIIGGVILILKGLDINGLRRVRPSEVKKRLSTRRADLRGYLLFFLAGILFSLAALFKIPAAFDFAAVLVFLFLVTTITKTKKNYSLSRSRLRRIGIPTSDSIGASGLITNYFLLTLGFFLPILLTIFYYASKNALNQYLTAAFFQNIPYLSSWVSGQTKTGGLPLLLMGRGMTVFLLALALFVLRKKISLAAKLILLWFAFSWFAALLSSRPYPHYLIQILPAFSLSFGLFFAEQKKRLKERVIPPVLLAVLVITFTVFHFWHYPNLPYYLNFYQYALRLKSQQEYFSDFDPKTETIYQLADYLKNHTFSDEKIFIWGNDPFIYALTKRLPVGRYTVSYHIIDFDGQEETLAALNNNPPRYLIVTGTEDRPFSELTAFIQNNYLLETRIDSAKIFHRQP